ncbi:Heavy metal transport/detoxification superfamily protein [Abeliophyllum distichum]|uniref:Heavy metal transport/detoxification superfamily protein n=1 Tax=Abeliophyllum distichum TaxID=126358 RepID=A0ABD1UNG7_9LAMI
MADQPPDPKTVLKVNINCCEACPKKLEKALLKLTGVSSLSINIEENLVSVSGTADPDTIIKLIYAKIGKKAKLVSYEPQSTNDVEEKPKNTKTAVDKDSDSNNNKKSKHKGKMHTRCCCQHGNCPKMGNDVHKCEDYVPPPVVKDFVCRDYFCKVHPRSREITDKVPANESSARMSGYLPNYARGYYGGATPWYPIRSSYYPRGYPEGPPAQYGYYQPPRRLQPPFGFY